MQDRQHIVFIKGVADDNKAIILPQKQGKPIFRLLGCSNISQYLKMKDIDQEELLISGRQNSKYYVKRKPSVIFNEISDPDTQIKSLRACQQSCDVMHSETGAYVINAPSGINNTKKEIAAVLLSEVNSIIMPRSVRIKLRHPKEVLKLAKKHKIKLPFLVKMAGSQHSTGMALIHKKGDIEQLHALPLDGRDYYVSEFFDTQSRDGYYRKHRLVVVGDQIFLRNMIVCDEWHGYHRRLMSEHSEFQKEESMALDAFETRWAEHFKPIIATLSQRLGLDIYSIEGHLTPAGQLLIFDINANMNILFVTPNTPGSVKVQVEKIRQAIQDFIRAKSQECPVRIAD